MTISDEIRAAVCEYTEVDEGMEWTPDPKFPGVYAVHTDSGKEFLLTRASWFGGDERFQIEEVEFTTWPPVEGQGGAAWKMELH